MSTARADLGGGCRGCAPLPPRDDLRFSNTAGILPKKTMWFIGVEVEQETSAPPPLKKSWIRPCTEIVFRNMGAWFSRLEILQDLDVREDRLK